MNCTRKFRCDGVMYMIKVLLADDQELIRESLGFVLGAQGDITVVGMAKNGREAIELVRSEKPDVVLMDIRMPEVDGVECTRLIKSAHPNIKVIVLTTFDDDEYVFNALRFGASGYLLKGVSVADLTNAVREVVRGGSIIAPDVASKALEMFARMAKGNLTIGVDEKQSPRRIMEPLPYIFSIWPIAASIARFRSSAGAALATGAFSFAIHSSSQI